MTKREYFAEFVDLAMGNDRADLVEFAEKEIALLDKRNSANSKAKAEKAEKNAKIADDIVAFLAEKADALSTMEIGAGVGISPQKATPILKGLVADGRVVVTSEKRKNLYSLPSEE